MGTSAGIPNLALDGHSTSRERAESEQGRLEAALALRDAAEQQRLARLEHDLRSALSVIVGFAAILKEQAEKNSPVQASLVLKSINAIQQAAKKTLLILDDATVDSPALTAEPNTVEAKL